MTYLVFIYLICAFGIFQKGLTALVQTQRTVVATVGDEACLKCQLMQSKNVLQVTWQKILPEGEENLATYNKYFGERVNTGFQGKVEFQDAGLQNCSIVIRKVVEQDEGCYHCLFNTHPDGSFIGTTCLQLYELHEPVLHVRQTNSSEETVVSCSATGRPAPTVTLSALQRDLHFSSYSSVSVTNSNGTVTVTTTAVLSAFHYNSTQVGCAARVLSAPQIEVFLMIPQVKESSADDFDEESGSSSDHTSTWIIVCVVVFSCGCVAVVTAVYLFIRRHRNSLPHRDFEKNKTPIKPIERPHETKTPLNQQVAEQVRLRASTGKNKTSSNLKATSSETSCRQQLFK